MIDSILLGADLILHQAFLSGETKEVEPSVLSAGQVRGEEPLPPELEAGDEPTPRIVSDALWQAYFHNAAKVAKARGSKFLAEWVAHEAAMKNALAVARAKALDLDPNDYLVAPELGGEDENFSSLISEWAAAPTPLEGLKVLDRARWNWLAENDAWFSFSDDEIAAYSAKLMLIIRWHRLAS